MTGASVGTQGLLEVEDNSIYVKFLSDFVYFIKSILEKCIN